MTPRWPWLLGVSTLLSLAGCPAEPEAGGASGLPKVHIQLNWLPEPQFGGIYAADTTGAFARHGLTVEIRKGGPDVPAVQLAASGQVEFAVAAADEVFQIREGGADVVAVFATYQTAPQGIMTHAGRGLTSLEALLQAEGKLAVQPGLSYVEYLRKRHAMAGLQLVTYQGGIGQFLADPQFAQQCFVTSEPIAARREGADPQVFLIADSGFNPYTSVIITRRDYLEKNPEQVAALVAALQEGWKSYLDDPAPANAVMRTLNPSLDAETFRLAAEAQVPLIETDETHSLGLGAMTMARWEELAKQLKEIGVCQGTAAAADCFVTVGTPSPTPGK